MSEDSDFFAHVIYNYGVQIFLYNGTDFEKIYDLTFCTSAHQGRISQDHFIFACGSGQVYIVELGNTSYSIVSNLNDHSSSVTSVQINRTL